MLSYNKYLDLCALIVDAYDVTSHLDTSAVTFFTLVLLPPFSITSLAFSFVS